MKRKCKYLPLMHCLLYSIPIVISNCFGHFINGINEQNISHFSNLSIANTNKYTYGYLFQDTNNVTDACCVFY